MIAPPLQSASFDTEAPDSQSTGPKPRVLIVDDHAPSHMILSLIMKQFGFDCIAVDSAEAAVREMQHSQNGFDLLLMDVILDDGNGVAAAATLRAMAQATGKLGDMHILLVTGAPELINHNSAAWLSAQISGILPKPISARTLFDNLGPLHERMNRRDL